MQWKSLCLCYSDLNVHVWSAHFGVCCVSDDIVMLALSPLTLPSPPPLTLSPSHPSSSQGHWRADLKHGEGVCRYPDGQVYEGHYQEGRRQGKGKLTLAGGGGACCPVCPIPPVPPSVPPSVVSYLFYVLCLPVLSLASCPLC